MEDFTKFVPIQKVDPEQRMVFGYASTPDLDSQGEIVSIDAIKNALPDYLRYPTIREMHQPKAAGVTKQTQIDERGLYIGAKVVDKEAWEKVKEGVYGGFSIGGSIKSKEGNTITDLELVEISLVDSPANKNAQIELWKSNTKSTHLIKWNKETIKMFAKEVIKRMADKELHKADDEVVAEEATEVSAETPEVSEEATPEEGGETAENADETEGGEPETVEASAQAEDLAKIVKQAIAEGLAKAMPKQEVEKVEFVKVDAFKALEERVKSLENTPAISKVKSPAVPVEKFEDTKEQSGRVAEINKRLEELAEMREKNLGKYQTEGYAQEAYKLLTEKDALK